MPWTRRVDAATWMAEERSKSYIAQLGAPTRARLLGRIEELLGTNFPRDADGGAVPDPHVAGPQALTSTRVLAAA